MRDLLARILGNSHPWVREHRNAEVVEVQSFGSDASQETVYTFEDRGERAKYHVDNLGNVLSVEAS